MGGAINANTADYLNLVFMPMLGFHLLACLSTIAVKYTLNYGFHHGSMERETRKLQALLNIINEKLR